MRDAERVFTAKLSSTGPLSKQDRGAIARLDFRESELGAHEDAVSQGSIPTDCCLLMSGLMYRYYLFPDGRRQILAIHTPGEIPDLHSLHLRRMDHGLAAIVRSRVAYISHASMRDVIRNYPRLVDLFWKETLIDAAVFRQWIVNVGRREARERLAHFLCELYERLKAVGLTEGNAFRMPLTQSEIADVLGLSLVHVNRTIQALKRDGLVEQRDGTYLICDLARLRDLAEFDAGYLSLVTER